MPESRVSVVRQHLTAAAVSLFNESLKEGGAPPPHVERAARLVDEALAELDAGRAATAPPAAAPAPCSAP